MRKFFTKEDIFLKLECFKKFNARSLHLWVEGRFAKIGIAFQEKHTYNLFSIYVGNKNSDLYKYLKEYIEDYCDQHNAVVIEK